MSTASRADSLQVERFFDARTWTLTYLVYDPTSKDAVIIDPVHDYDPLRVKFFEESIAGYIARVEALGLKLHWSLETHAHADHISAGVILRERLGARLAIGAAITGVQGFFAGVFGRRDISTDGSQFDQLLQGGDVLEAGSLSVNVLATPGHTPACVTFQVGDTIFTGDALFMPDYGTGRCDFPKGSAAALYRSIRSLYTLPDETRVFVGHDYQPGGRPVAWETTIGASKRENIQLRADTSEADYVRFRTERDAKLTPPNLIFQSIQCNIDGGRLPPVGPDGLRRLTLPVGLFP